MKSIFSSKISVPRKTLSPVFIVEEDIRPLDLTTNLDSLIIKDLSSLTDMNLQHVELIPLLLVVEPILQGIPSQTGESNLTLREGRKDISMALFLIKHLPI